MNINRIKYFFEEVYYGFLGILSTLAISILYFLFGALLSIPYIFLSGGEVKDIFISALIAPIAFLLFVAFWPRKELRHSGRFRDILTYIFIIYVVYLTIPILLNFVSFFIGKMGYDKISDIIFSLRYISLILLPVVVIMLILIISFVINSYQKTKSFFKSTNSQ